MDLITRGDLQTLAREHTGPCLSLFMPAHRGGSEADPIRWRGLLSQAEQLLAAAGQPARAIKKLLEPTSQLLQDTLFWKHQCDGLALFLAPGFLRLYRLPLAFAQQVVVGDCFHIRPLLPLLAADGRFFVLALSQNAIRLLQGTSQTISEVDLTGVPHSLAEALLTHDRDEPLTFHGRPAGGIGSWGAIFHGHGVGIDDVKDNLLTYFQRLDRGLHPVLREERAPLVVAAVEYFHPLYRQANTYPHLLEEGIEGSPDRLTNQELHARAWALVRPGFAAVRERALAQYRQLAGTGRTASDLAEILSAASRGEIETLFVPRQGRCWGRFEPVTEQVEEHDRPEPGDEELFNLAAVLALRQGRTVHVVEPGEVADGGPLAAIYFLPLARRGKR